VRSDAYFVYAAAPGSDARHRLRAAIAGSGEVAGSVDVRPGEAGSAIISSLFVEREHRRRGVSRQLMRTALQTARLQGRWRATLEARSEDPDISEAELVSLYREFGFRVTGNSALGNPMMEAQLSLPRSAIVQPMLAQAGQHVVQCMDDEHLRRHQGRAPASTADPDRQGRVRAAMDRAEAISQERRGRILQLGGREIVIGIPYRDDQWGNAVQRDLEAVAEGTRCRVVIVPPGISLNIMRLDALFFPGGPFDQPNTQAAFNSKKELVSKFRSPKPGAQEKEATDRHRRELILIQQAEQCNLPILGICGGSRRLATAKGATQVHLHPAESRTHTSHMDSVRTQFAHTVQIEPNTLLHRIVATGHYRLISRSEVRKEIERAQQEALTIDVNSVHWASSHFPPGSPVHISARSPTDAVVEGFEDPRYHFHVGVQWHPEYAQYGEGDFEGRAKPHQRVMASLGQAALEGRAANIIGRAIRTYNERNRLGSMSAAAAPTTLEAPRSPVLKETARFSLPQGPPSALVPPPTSPVQGPGLGSTGPQTSLVSAFAPGPRSQQFPWGPPPASSGSHTHSRSSATPTSPAPRRAPQPSYSSSSHSQATTRITGTVVKFDSAKGFGFLQYQGRDYFFHVKSVEQGVARFGARATFDPAPGDRGPVAKNVRFS
jgi:gamma-glutamyl-gamma-aminobutyrate hydrolase PuuD/cold shock CspA family protein/GNAT superfamily N-acetyltransferase